jgi:hypothetical protein
MALAYAQSLDRGGKFYSIHSKKEGQVGRVILGCGVPHLGQLGSNNELEAHVGDENQAKEVHRMFKDICRKTAMGLGIPLRDLESTEIIKNEPHALGQIEHMDAMGGVWNFFAPLVNSPATMVKNQLYQDYPLNIGTKSTVPRNWSTLPDIPIKWEVGDLLMLRSNAIHGGPTNGKKRRYVLFGSEESSTQNEHTDALVVTEQRFFRHKKKEQLS